MHIPPRFRITITGDRMKVWQREHVQEGIARLLGQLVIWDGDFPLDAFKPWGLTVTVEEDRDA